MSKNAKFEKWCASHRGKYFPCFFTAKKLNGEEYVGERTKYAWLGWQSAIQSLEVTPELVEAAIGGFNGHGTAFMTLDRADIRAMTAALTAVFNAIKEQAK